MSVTLATFHTPIWPSGVEQSPSGAALKHMSTADLSSALDCGENSDVYSCARERMCVCLRARVCVCVCVCDGGTKLSGFVASLNERVTGIGYGWRFGRFGMCIYARITVRIR